MGKSEEIKVFVLETYKDGERRVWPEALPAKTAFAAARSLAKDGYRPKLLKITLSREQYMKLDPKEIAFRMRAS